MSEELQQKAFYGGLALLTVALMGWGMASAGPEGIAFGLFAALIICGGLSCVWERSVVRSAFALMATFSGVAGFFVLLHADFLAMAQLLIYVGGILVLILFGVMLTPPDLTERKLPRVAFGTAALLVGVAWVGAQVAATVGWKGFPELADPGPPSDNAERIGIGFLRADAYVVAFELAAVVLTVALVAAVYIARRRRDDLEAAPTAGGFVQFGSEEGER